MKNLLFLVLLLPMTAVANPIVNEYSDMAYNGPISKEIKTQGYPKSIVDPSTKQEYAMDEIVRGIIKIESDFDNRAKTNEKRVNDHSYGLMQIRCKTAKANGLK